MVLLLKVFFFENTAADGQKKLHYGTMPNWFDDLIPTY